MQSIFFNYSFNKNKLRTLLMWYMMTYGQNDMIELAEKLKTLGFYHATYAGISLGIDDLRTVSAKYQFIDKTYKNIKNINKYYEIGAITEVQKSDYLIENWQKISEILKIDISQKFKTIKKLNPIYMMAFSGARGNISQVRQLIGMRGLMADPNGQIIHLPITSNFREGLTTIEYLISCYGARKGVVDTALRTATAGYLTRRLVDTAQHVIISQLDCLTKKGLFLSNLYKNKQILLSLKDQLYGRVLGKKISLKTKKIFFSRNQQIDELSAILLAKNLSHIYVRSSLRCQAPNLTLCQLCYGWNLSYSKLISLGEIVGVIAAQSIGEPGTQLTMRTFHTGGVFSGTVMSDFYAPFKGIIFYSSTLKGNVINTYNCKTIFLVKQKGLILINPIQDSFLKDKRKITLDTLRKKSLIFAKKFEATPYTTIFVKNKEYVQLNQLIAKKATTLSSNQQVEAYYTVSSKIEGEVFFDNFSKIKNFSQYLSPFYSKTLKKRKNMWILNGKIYRSIFPLRSFLKIGDIISRKFPIAKIKLLNSSSSFLRVLFIQKSLKTTYNTDTQKYQISIFTEKPLYSIGLKDIVYTNQNFIFSSTFLQEIETEKTLRLTILNRKQTKIFSTQTISARKTINNRLRLEQRNIFSKSFYLNNYNEKVLSFYKSDNINWFFPHSFIKKHSQILDLKTWRSFINSNQLLKDSDKIKNKQYQLKKKFYTYMYFNFSKNDSFLKDNFFFIKKRFINLFFKTSDCLKIIDSNFFGQIGFLNSFYQDKKNFLYPTTSLRYNFQTYFSKYLNYNQEILNLSTNTFFRCRIRNKPIGIYNYKILQNKHYTQDICLTNFYVFLLTSSTLPFLFSLNSNRNNNVFISYYLNFLLKILNPILFSQPKIKILLDLFLFLKKYGIFYHITLSDKLEKIGKYLFDIGESLSIIETTKNESLFVLINNSYFQNKFIINLVNLKQNLKIKNKFLSLLTLKTKTKQQLKFNHCFSLQNQLFYEFKNFKKQLNYPTTILFSQVLNLSPIDGWVFLSNYPKKINEKQIKIENLELKEKSTCLSNLLISVEKLFLPILLRELSSFFNKLKFWNSLEKNFFSHSFCISNSYKKILNQRNYFFISRKIGQFFPILSNNLYSKNFKKFNRSKILSYSFIKFSNIFISRIIFKINIPYYVCLKSIKSSFLYSDVNYKNKFLSHNSSLSFNLLNYKFKELYYKNHFYSFYNTFSQLQSNLFNKRKLTKLNFSGFYKKIKLFFFITIPLLKPTYFYKSSYITKLGLENKFFLFQSLKLTNSLNKNNYYFLNQKTNSINTKLKLPILNLRNIVLYFNCSLINNVLQRTLEENEENICIKEKINFSLTHLNWLPRLSSIVQISLLNPYEGEIKLNKFSRYSNSYNFNAKLLIITNKDIDEFHLFKSINQNTLLRKKAYNKKYFINKPNFIYFYHNIGSLIHSTDLISQGKNLGNPGQIISLLKNKLIIRKGKPMFFSLSGIFYIWNGDFLQKDSSIMTLLYNKLKTGDIVQGIPKIEHFFEARKSLKDVSNSMRNNLLLKLLIIFVRFKRRLCLSRAVRRSLAKIQKIIIDGIVRVYCSQGITISRKHFEIIIRQMTSKVRIVDGGGTGLLEGEFINLSKIEKINANISSKGVIYEPLVLGITKTSLKTESFISSASFQETTRVLSLSALERKIDFLNGLKENVILSKLIPGGTGIIMTLNISNLNRKKNSF